MRGFGGVVSFELRGALADGSRFVDALRIPQIAPSLGGVESLVEQPSLMSFYELTPEQRAKIGIKDNLVRFRRRRRRRGRPRPRPGAGPSADVAAGPEEEAASSHVGASALTLSLLVAGSASAQTFGEDVAFLKSRTSVVVLTDGKTGARVAVCPDLQGRVMTSSARGEAGPSFGWINRELLTSASATAFQRLRGEDRFWLGPEAGQFGLFFKKGDPFDLAHWHTPAAIDTEPYPVRESAPDRVSFRKPMSLVNYSGASFDLRLDRTVKLLAAREALAALGAGDAAGLEVVAYESENRIENTGASAWRKETGLISVWILGMFKPSPTTTVIVPFEPIGKGPLVNDAYFGKVPADRLVMRGKTLFFRGDGLFRSKIGLPPGRAKSVLGSYEAAGRVLTLVEFTLPKDATDYVNSMWEVQAAPYGGRRFEQLQRRAAGARSQGARPLLRARDLVARGRAGPWPGPRASASDAPPGG